MKISTPQIKIHNPLPEKNGPPSVGKGEHHHMQVKEFKYPGVLFMAEGRRDKTTDERMDIAVAVVLML